MVNKSPELHGDSQNGAIENSSAVLSARGCMKWREAFVVGLVGDRENKQAKSKVKCIPFFLKKGSFDEKAGTCFNF